MLYRVEFTIKFEEPTGHCPAEIICWTEFVGSWREGWALLCATAQLEDVSTVELQQSGNAQTWLPTHCEDPYPLEEAEACGNPPAPQGWVPPECGEIDYCGRIGCPICEEIGWT